MGKYNFPTNDTRNSLDDAENSVLFADYILKWLPKQIRVRNLSLTLANALSDDTHEISLHLSSFHTGPSKKKNNANSFIWNKERRFFHLFLDILDGTPNLLPKAFGIPMNDEDNQLEPLENGDIETHEDDIDDMYKKYYSPKDNVEDLQDDDEEDKELDWCKEIQQQKQLTLEQRQKFGRLKLSNGVLYLNLKSLIKSKVHKKILTNWWIYGDLGKGLSPINLVSQKYNELVNKNYGKKDWEPSSKELRHCMSMFTRKLSPYISNRINAYWYRVKYVEFDPEKKRKRKKRNIIVKSYQKLVYCKIFFTQFTKNKDRWDHYLKRFPEIEILFNNRFKTSLQHPYETTIEELIEYRLKLKEAEANHSNLEIIDESQDNEEEDGVLEERNSTQYPNSDEVSKTKLSSSGNKISKLLGFSNRRKSWEVKIDNFASDLIEKLESIIPINKSLINSEIDILKDQIRRLKNRRF